MYVFANQFAYVINITHKKNLFEHGIDRLLHRRPKSQCVSWNFDVDDD